LVCVDELGLLRGIERLLKSDIEKQIIPGYEPDPRIKAEPIDTGRGQRPRGQGAGARRNTTSSARNARSGQHQRSTSPRRRAAI
jgi:ATP-dependent RNA helicase RhlE